MADDDPNQTKVMIVIGLESSVPGARNQSKRSRDDDDSSSSSSSSSSSLSNSSQSSASTKKKKRQHKTTTTKTTTALMETLRHPPPSSYNGFKSSNSPPLCYLSNFFGGAEFTFMALRSESQHDSEGAQRLTTLYRTLRDVEWETDSGYATFKILRKRLQPKSKDNDYYLKQSAPPGAPRVAAGLLAKLISGCYRKSMKARLKVVNELANEYLGSTGACIVSSDIVNGTAVQKKAWMEQTLELKFSTKQSFYRELLMAAHVDYLFEGKGRDSAGANFPGRNGWLRTCLVKVKEGLN